MSNREFLELMLLVASYMLHGRNVEVYELEQITKESASYIYEQIPWMKKELDSFGDCYHEEWISMIVDKQGEEVELIPMHLEDHEKLDLFESLARLGIDANEINILPLDPSEEPPDLCGNVNWN